MLPAVEEADKKLFRIERYFKEEDAFFFEKWTIGNEQAISDFLANHRLAPCVICLIYGAGLYFGQKWMENRPPFQVRPQLVLWNLFLALFSVFGTYRCATDTLVQLRDYGVLATVCHPSGYVGITGFWATLFVFSKPLEFGDTVFIVLRKQKLQTLHWYHHMSVLCYACYLYSVHLGVGRYFATINYLVHSLMYTYFALRAARVRMPNVFAIFITALQILQMAVALAALGYGFYIKKFTQIHCQIDDISVVAGFLMYFSFLFMFMRLFLKKYIKGDPDTFHGEGSAERKPMQSREHTDVEKKYTNGKSHTNGHYKKAE